MPITIDKDHEAQTPYSPVCSYCTHLNLRGFRAGFRTCDAFDRIPDEIWEGHHDHRTPFPGDRGIRFEPVVPRREPEGQAH